MDIFHIESSDISSSIVDTDHDTSVTDEITEVKFESHSEFDLNFFDTPDDSMTQGAFSNPNSVESSVSLAPTPEPPISSNNVINNGIYTISSTSSPGINLSQQNAANIKTGKTNNAYRLNKHDKSRLMYANAKFLAQHSLPYDHAVASLLFRLVLNVRSKKYAVLCTPKRRKK